MCLMYLSFHIVNPLYTVHTRDTCHVAFGNIFLIILTLPFIATAMKEYYFSASSDEEQKAWISAFEAAQQAV